MQYSFKDWKCAIFGPGGSCPLGDESGAAEEGMTFEPEGDKNVMAGGADGSWVHSKLAGKRGKATFRCLKGSKSSAVLQAMFNAQDVDGVPWGQNTISGTHMTTGATVVCVGVAFANQAPMNFAAEAGTEEWVFHVGRMEFPFRGIG